MLQRMIILFFWTGQWLVREAEVQPLAAFIRCRFPIRQFLINTHSVPNHISLLIAPNVVEFGKDIEKYVEDAYPNEHTVASAI